MTRCPLTGKRGCIRFLMTSGYPWSGRRNPRLRMVQFSEMKPKKVRTTNHLEEVNYQGNKSTADQLVDAKRTPC